MLVSGVQQSDSVIHTHSFFFRFFSHIGCHKILVRVFTKILVCTRMRESIHTYIAFQIKMADGTDKGNSPFLFNNAEILDKI